MGQDTPTDTLHMKYIIYCSTPFTHWCTWRTVLTGQYPRTTSIMTIRTRINAQLERGRKHRISMLVDSQLEIETNPTRLIHKKSEPTHHLFHWTFSPSSCRIMYINIDFIHSKSTLLYRDVERSIICNANPNDYTCSRLNYKRRGVSLQNIFNNIYVFEYV